MATKSLQVTRKQRYLYALVPR